jgi:gliding motility-associated-like protein
MCSFNLGNDSTFCQNPSTLNLTINGPSGYDSYLWSPGGATTQNLPITSNGTYACTATIYSGDLVVNGNFSLGNTAFTSNYVLGFGGTWGPVSSPATFSVTTSPNIAHSNFLSFGDHTTGTGNMLVCNGSSVANDIVWSQTINVSSNTNYNFSAWVSSLESVITAGTEAQLQFSINGVLIGPVHNAPLTGGVWSNFFVIWNSGINTTAVITIVDQNITGSGNDFALDDIFFQQICVFTDSIIITAVPFPMVDAGLPQSIACNAVSVVLSGTSSALGSTYSWSGSGIISGSTTANPTVGGGGTYSLTVTEPIAGCTSTDVVLITLDVMPTAQFSATPNSGTNPLVVVYTNTSLNATASAWFFGDGNTALNNNSPSNTFLSSGNYTTMLIVSASGVGCIDTTYFSIEVHGAVSLVIPNIFTPNGDGVNDVFKVNAEGIIYFNCKIFDRWGLNIYEINDVAQAWHGKTNGSALVADGCYYYTIEATDINNNQLHEKGSITLIRSN